MTPSVVSDLNTRLCAAAAAPQRETTVIRLVPRLALMCGLSSVFGAAERQGNMFKGKQCVTYRCEQRTGSLIL